MSLYKDVTRCFHGNAQNNPVLSDDELLFQYELMHPRVILRISRLMLFSRLVCKAPQQLMKLVRDMAVFEKGWTKSVLSDLVWLSLSDDLSMLAGMEFGDCIDYVGSHMKAFKRSVRKFSRLRIANFPSEPNNCGPTDLVSAISAGHKCSVCELVFGTFQKLCLHSFKKHGNKSIWRLYVGSYVHCYVCMKQFWSHERLLNHVRYRSSVCRHNMRLRGPIFDETQAREFEKSCASVNVSLHRQGKRRHAIEEPVVQLSGPRMPILEIPSS